MSVSELEKLRLKLYTDGDTSGDPDNSYDIYPIDNVELRSRKDALSVAPPGLAARQNILLGVSGMEAEITINFKIYDDGEDRANGTFPDPITGVSEQIKYLEDTMHAPDFGVAWELDHLTGPAFSDDDVFVETVDAAYLNQDSPKWRDCRMDLRRGGSV